MKLDFYRTIRSHTFIFGIYFRSTYTVSRSWEIGSGHTDGPQSDPLRVPFFLLRDGTLKINPYFRGDLMGSPIQTVKSLLLHSNIFVETLQIVGEMFLQFKSSCKPALLVRSRNFVYLLAQTTAYKGNNWIISRAQVVNISRTYFLLNMII